jgi:hypothetical protein
MVLQQVITPCMTRVNMPAFLLAPAGDPSAPRRAARGQWLQDLAEVIVTWRERALHRVGRADLIRRFGDIAGVGSGKLSDDILEAVAETVADLTRRIAAPLPNMEPAQRPAYEEAKLVARLSAERLATMLVGTGSSQGVEG